MMSERLEQKFHTDDMSASSASDWLKHLFNQSEALKQDLGSETWSVIMELRKPVVA